MLNKPGKFGAKLFTNPHRYRDYRVRANCFSRNPVLVSYKASSQPTGKSYNITRG